MTTDTNVGLSFDVCPSDATVPASRRAEILTAPGFGQIFTDHMVTIRWSRDRGWHDAKLEPYGPLTLDPATSVLHYAQEIFEGLKAYRQVDGSIVTFRPQANAARFRRSARRLAMPELPEELFVRAIDVLVTHDRDWVPAEEGNSLYLRPFMIATQRGLGVNSPSYSYLFLVIASPVAAYFSGGVRPVTVWLSEDYTRAAPGSTGDSLLKLAPDLGVPAEEGRISVPEWRSGNESGEITEVFACGTAAVITPVGRVRSVGREWTVGDGGPGPITMRLREELLGIQYGRRRDPYGWIHPIC